MSDPMNADIVYRWQALDYSGYCYGSNPPDNLPERCNLTPFYRANETFVADVRRFTEAVGCTTDRFNVRQTALYIGLQLEEMAEKLEACGFNPDCSAIVEVIRITSGHFKRGAYDESVSSADRAALLDADIDLAWVTIGSALSQGADVLGAMREVARANLDKIGPDGTVLKDKNGKVRKPEGWRAPDLVPFVCREDRHE